MNEEIVISQAEAASVGLALAQNYRNGVRYYQRELKWSADKALARADENREPDEHSLERIATIPPQDLSWFDLELAERAQPGQALALWEQIKQAAREELRNGQRGGEAVLDRMGTPFDRAEYLALYESLARDWQPQNGIEWTLIEQLAQAQTMYLYWLRVCQARIMREYKGLSRAEAQYEAPRVSEAECQEFAANMTDRFHRLFLRTLRALRDLRRYNAPVIVQNAGQVNVAAAGGQQVNMMQAQE